MNSPAISGLLKRVYDHFDIQEFDDRLKLQKYFYLIQAHGINLGYVFSLYLRGPYCPELTKTAFMIEYYPKSKPVRFDDPKTEERFVVH